MTTLGTMRSRIARELVNEEISDVEIDDAIRTAVKTYERREWWFNERRVTFSTTSGDAIYQSSTASDFENIVKIISATCDTGSDDRRTLREISYDEYEDSQDGSVTGRPTCITVFNNSLYLYPTPDATYTIRLSHIRKYDELTDNDDTNPWVDEAEELIRQSAKRRIALDTLHDEALATRCAALERDALDAMLAENRRRKPKKTMSVDAMFTVPESFNINRGW